jgi:L-iditol 2-dehydrogenase
MKIGATVPGGFCEYTVVPGRAIRYGCLNKVPAGLSARAAALSESLACCLNAQEMLGVGVGDSVLVIGAGPAGCLNALLARARGASRVFMADRLANRLELAEVTSADLYLNTAERDLHDELMAHTDERGADVVVVACASREAQEQALQVAASGGRVCFFGALPDGEPSVRLDVNRLHYREQMLIGSHGATPAQHYRGLQLMAGRHMGAEKVITHRFALDEIEAALGAVERREGLKVVVEPAEEP